MNTSRPNTQLIKDYFRKPSTLIRGILELLMIGAGFGLIAGFDKLSTELIGIINEYADNPIPAEAAAMYSIPSYILPAIVMLLTAIAWFIIFGMSRSDSESTRPDAGFVILNIFAIEVMLPGT